MPASARMALWATLFSTSVGCGRKEPVPLQREQAGDRSGAIGSADPQGANGLLPPGTVFKRASAKLESQGEGRLTGSAKLEEVTGGVRIEVSVRDAPAGKKLGVHVDEKGDCSDPARRSMGGHFNPRNAPHGFPDAADHHLGDLGNVAIDADGKGELLILTAGGNLRQGDALSFLGRTIVVDDAPDDGTPQSGGSGKPLGCGRIGPS